MSASYPYAKPYDLPARPTLRYTRDPLLDGPDKKPMSRLSWATVAVTVVAMLSTVYFMRLQANDDVKTQWSGNNAPTTTAQNTPPPSVPIPTR